MNFLYKALVMALVAVTPAAFGKCSSCKAPRHNKVRVAVFINARPVRVAAVRRVARVLTPVQRRVVVARVVSPARRVRVILPAKRVVVRPALRRVAAVRRVVRPVVIKAAAAARPAKQGCCKNGVCSR